MQPRSPTLDETRLLQYLISLAGCGNGFYPLSQVLVLPMEDGGMGSLRIGTAASFGSDRKFGKQIAACSFEDADGIKVIASLNIDSDDGLFELDIWKSNYEKLIRLPLSDSELSPSG